ncbi:hypothetical protein [Derxia lacustris]|uniref:hypothetical protein n=1 Tax=Derxia lacustris TaxID=764842 RepID=UPI00111C33F2|nr:hypothetical protein [Derxia lacustris]
MAFVTEWLDENDRQNEGINVTNWVVDRERDIALWIRGKHWQVRAEGDWSETVILRIKGEKLVFEMMPASNFRSYIEGTVHDYVWEKIISYSPNHPFEMPHDEVIKTLKAALIVRGDGAYIKNYIQISQFPSNFKFQK